MRLFEIETKLELLSSIKIIEHRRLVTPIFTKRLSPKYYGYVHNQKGWFFGIITRFTGWEEIKQDGRYYLQEEKANEIKAFVSSQSNINNVIPLNNRA